MADTNTQLTDEAGTTWLVDQNNNRASVEYFGSLANAEKALASLKNCRDCTNCSGCSGCSRCSDCSDCSDCSRCSGCARCSDCSGCSGCSRCSDCSDCSDCSRCSGCARCSDCSGCSGCSDLADPGGLVRNKTGVKGDGEGWQRPPVPVIPNIHRAVYDAVTAAPEQFEMGSWHQQTECGMTHCRGGWVVTLAGEAGKKLEDATSTLHAAMLIYRASDPTWRMSNFFDSNEGALADMKAMAERGFAGHVETQL